MSKSPRPTPNKAISALSCSAGRRVTGGAPPERVLVVQFRGVGDVILTAPLLDALARVWPDAQVSLWTRAESARLFSNDPRVSRVLVRGPDAALAAAVHGVRRARFDLVLDPQSVFLTAFAARASGGYAVGFRRRIRGGWPAWNRSRNSWSTRKKPGIISCVSLHR